MNLLTELIIKYLFFFFLLLNFSSCDTKTKKKVDIKKANFYHWKVNANLEEYEKKALETAKTKKVFLHYFDVVKDTYSEKPVAVLREVDAVLKDKEIVPVIFIRNSIFKTKHFYGEYLVRQIIDLTKQIHQHHFKKTPTEIQIDCDWTEGAKEHYFKFLSLLKEKIKVSITIRLHQIKYKHKTGTPPVDYGTIMLYNVGDLKNTNQNSILESTIVNQYISEDTDYPLALDVALPIFSQVVLINNKEEVRLINTVNFDKIKNDTKHFSKETATLFKVKKKILFKGQYLYKDFKVKLEESTIDEVVKSYEIIKNSKLNVKDVTLYHLDEETLGKFNVSELLEKLK